MFRLEVASTFQCHKLEMIFVSMCLLSFVEGIETMVYNWRCLPSLYCAGMPEDCVIISIHLFRKPKWKNVTINSQVWIMIFVECCYVEKLLLVWNIIDSQCFLTYKFIKIWLQLESFLLHHFDLDTHHHVILEEHVTKRAGQDTWVLQ